MSSFTFTELVVLALIGIQVVLRIATWFDIVRVEFFISCAVTIWLAYTLAYWTFNSILAWERRSCEGKHDQENQDDEGEDHEDQDDLDADQDDEDQDDEDQDDEDQDDEDDSH